MDRFKAVLSKVSVPDSSAISALKQGLWHESEFRRDLVQHKAYRLDDVLHRASGFIRVEEDRAMNSKKQSALKPSTPKPKSAKERIEDDYQEPRQHYDQDYKAKLQVNQVGSSNQSSQSSQGQSNKWVRGQDSKEGQSYCTFHKKYGHATSVCRSLMNVMLGKYNKSEIRVESPQTQAEKNEAPRPELKQRPVGNANPPVPPKRLNNQQVSPDAPSASKRKVLMIMGGAQLVHGSVRSLKQHEKLATQAQRCLVRAEVDMPIIFSEADTKGLAMPHNDPLVIELRIKPNVKPLTGFDGVTTMTIGSIKLDVYAGGITKAVKFLIVDRPAIYNVIMGTPWLISLRAVPSTYHLCLKFPTQTGVFTIRGDQKMARTCFVTQQQLRRVSLHISTTEQSHASEPRKDVSESVVIDPARPERRVNIGIELINPIRSELMQFLAGNAETFAWTAQDMKGISPSITSHRLNVDPTFKPIRQKRRKLGSERAKAVNEEVTKLLDAGSITEVHYPEWLANPVVVKKKNGSWRVCVDFTDLNKACPKDSYPLPHIDRVVEATAGNELLSFMDAFSGYNQIEMHPHDREKTAFITERGTYCYRVMPFGLKNAGATYQRLVNKMFAEQLGDTMELNPAKCTFGVTSGEFLGYIVTQRGIEANPKQIAAIANLPSPKNKREVQRLSGRIAALNCFISRSTDRSLPFYQLLRGNKSFAWDDKCESAFQDLKQYLTTPPILSKPELGETLYLYVSITDAAVSEVLVREDRGDQKPIFYVSKALDGAESRYPTLEKLALAVVMSARKLRPYFQSHTIAVMSTQPLRAILHSPSQSGRMARWAVELSEFDLEFRNRTTAKSQVLADFVTELPPSIESVGRSDIWNLYVDGSASRHGSGIGILLVSHTGDILEQSFRLGFRASNNEAEWEALIAGLRLAREMGARRIHAFSDSQLVTNQLNHEYDARDDRMSAYLQLTKKIILDHFDSFLLSKVPRAENSKADALASLGSSSGTERHRTIPVGILPDPSIELPRGQSSVMSITELEAEPEPDSEPISIPGASTSSAEWREEIIKYITQGIVPEDKWAVRRLKTRSAHYVMLEDKLFRWNATGVLLQCIAGSEIYLALAETHEGAGGSHSGGRTLALKIKKLGLYWPTMLIDCANHARCCEKCQRHGPMIKSPTEPLTTSAAAYPFMSWAMDIIGPFPKSHQKRYVIVITDYFTKWVEAEAYAMIRANDVHNFVWKFLICRHGLPYEIVTDNSSQFISNTFKAFCARWKIRLNKSTHRYPQGNGQAEATNKVIISELKKRLDEKKNLWADELDGVLWAFRTTLRQSTDRTPFSLAYGLEAMAPAEVNINSLRRSTMPKHPEANEIALLDNLDFVEEELVQALLRIQSYQQKAAQYYNRKVQG
ncbi:hypothetical protein AALP_AA8G272900 [Arabis alpina]|uniref:Uncharacterized protein n=1 Tax=Arabis alpina TaxID=50452 RepID=A0A087G9S1_ARAAL|nr:hypothetical protein AALP_AA8G272900 [Arabis alpina]